MNDRAIRRAEALIREVISPSPEDVRRSRILHCIKTSDTPREMIKMIRAMTALPENWRGD